MYKSKLSIIIDYIGIKISFYYLFRNSQFLGTFRELTMLKKYLIFCVIALSFTCILWAGGGKDNLSFEAEDPSGFTDSIDTSEREPGKYNYYLEATDRAGNRTISGPENIFWTADTR